MHSRSCIIRKCKNFCLNPPHAVPNEFNTLFCYSITNHLWVIMMTRKWIVFAKTFVGIGVLIEWIMNGKQILSDVKVTRKWVEIIAYKKKKVSLFPFAVFFPFLRLPVYLTPVFNVNSTLLCVHCLSDGLRIFDCPVVSNN